MKAVIFAGGVGTRLWPLSRRSSPKQFEKVIGDKSTLQIAAEKLAPMIGWSDIFISTQTRYEKLVAALLPKLPPENIIGEPEQRDVGPAVGLALVHIKKRFGDIPILILWSDHIVKNTSRFTEIIAAGNEYISQHRQKLLLITQKPRFASQNLGWVQYGSQKTKIQSISIHSFVGFHYRPSLPQAHKFAKLGSYAWNLGYFMVTTSYLWKLYKLHQPNIFANLQKIYEAVGTSSYSKVLSMIYPNFTQISFDNAILEQIAPSQAVVVCQDLGWSDIGAWEALKEALQSQPHQNVIKGKVLVTDCTDSLIYNYTDQMVVTIDLDGHLVVNTDDVLLVCHKNSVPKIKKLVEKLSRSENNHLI